MIRPLTLCSQTPVCGKAWLGSGVGLLQGKVCSCHLETRLKESVRNLWGQEGKGNGDRWLCHEASSFSVKAFLFFNFKKLLLCLNSGLLTPRLHSAKKVLDGLIGEARDEGESFERKQMVLQIVII